VTCFPHRTILFAALGIILVWFNVVLATATRVPWFDNTQPPQRADRPSHAGVSDYTAHKHLEVKKKARGATTRPHPTHTNLRGRTGSTSPADSIDNGASKSKIGEHPPARFENLSASEAATFFRVLPAGAGSYRRGVDDTRENGWEQSLAEAIKSNLVKHFH